eukprot:272256_1
MSPLTQRLPSIIFVGEILFQMKLKRSARRLYSNLMETNRRCSSFKVQAFPHVLDSEIIIVNIGHFQPDDLKVNSTGDCITSFQSKPRIASDMFGGRHAAINLWYERYYTTLRQHIKAGRFVGNDQDIIATICVENPELCYLFQPLFGFGDPHYFL